MSKTEISSTRDPVQGWYLCIPDVLFSELFPLANRYECSFLSSPIGRIFLRSGFKRRIFIKEWKKRKWEGKGNNWKAPHFFFISYIPFFVFLNSEKKVPLGLYSEGGKKSSRKRGPKTVGLKKLFLRKNFLFRKACFIFAAASISPLRVPKMGGRKKKKKKKGENPTNRWTGRTTLPQMD